MSEIKSQTIKVTWAPAAITGAVERTSELIRDYERHSFHLSDQMLTDLCALVDATRTLLAEHEQAEYPDVSGGGVPYPNDDEEREFVARAMHAAESGSAGHWPTVAAVLRDEVLRLRALVEPERIAPGRMLGEPLSIKDAVVRASGGTRPAVAVLRVLGGTVADVALRCADLRLLADDIERDIPAGSGLSGHGVESGERSE
jgi:hypothetical protein